MQPSFAKNFVFGLIGASFAAAPVLAQTASQMTPSQAEQSSGSDSAGSGTPSAARGRAGVGGSAASVTAAPSGGRAAEENTPSLGEQSSGSNNATSATPSSGNPRSNAQGIRTPGVSSTSTNTMPTGSSSGLFSYQVTPSQSEQAAGSANGD